MACGRGKKPIVTQHKVQEAEHNISSSENESEVNPRTPFTFNEFIEKVMPSYVLFSIPGPKLDEQPRDLNVKMNVKPAPTNDKPNWEKLKHPEKRGIALDFVDFDMDIVDVQLEDVEDGLSDWSFSLVGYFIGGKPTISRIEEFMSKTWKHVNSPKLLLIKRNWFIFKFSSLDDMDEILSGEQWFLPDLTLILKKWTPTIFHEIDKLTKLPIWVTFSELDPVLWAAKALSKIASRVGTPLFVDTITTKKKKKDSHLLR